MKHPFMELNSKQRFSEKYILETERELLKLKKKLKVKFLKIFWDYKTQQPDI